MIKFVIATLAVTTILVPFSAQATGVHPVPVPIVAGNGVGPGLLFVCVGGIIVAAIVKSQTENRELTTAEAISCGLLAWVATPQDTGVVPPQVRVRARFKAKARPQAQARYQAKPDCKALAQYKVKAVAIIGKPVAARKLFAGPMTKRQLSPRRQAFVRQPTQRCEPVQVF